MQLKNFIITENSTKFNQQSMGLSPAYSYLLTLLLTFFFLEPFFSTQSNILEINFSSCKSPSVHFSSCTDWKIVKLVTSTGHISCFSFLFLLSPSYFSSRHTCTARVCLCQWLYNIWSKYLLNMYFSSCSGFERAWMRLPRHCKSRKYNGRKL